MALCSAFGSGISSGCDADRGSNAGGIGSSSVDSDVDVNSVVLSAISITLSYAPLVGFFGENSPPPQKKIEFSGKGGRYQERGRALKWSSACRRFSTTICHFSLSLSLFPHSSPCPFIHTRHVLSAHASGFCRCTVGVVHRGVYKSSYINI